MNDNGKATRIDFFNFSTPSMRAFHMAWFAFFLCFFAWFGIAPLMTVVRDQMQFTKEISDRRDSAMLTCHSYSSRAAEVRRLGRTRTRNSNRFASYQSCFARSAWPHSANSSCP